MINFDLFGLAIWWLGGSIYFIAISDPDTVTTRHLFYLGYHADDNGHYCWHLDLFWILIFGSNR